LTFFGLSDDLLSQKIRNIAAAARGAATRISSHDWKEEEVVVVEAVAAAVEGAVDEVAAGRLALSPFTQLMRLLPSRVQLMRLLPAASTLDGSRDGAVFTG